MPELTSPHPIGEHAPQQSISILPMKNWMSIRTILTPDGHVSAMESEKRW